jgi:prepilin-type N-terminal cleavage/methylation domain-containing protein
MKKTNKKTKKGFTLVEIMIVVAIIGLLAAIGVPSIMNAYSNAQEKTKLRNIADIEKAKAMLTLPEDAGGLALTTNDTPTKAQMETALNIESFDDDLKVGNEVPTINRIGVKATYAPVEE